MTNALERSNAGISPMALYMVSDSQERTARVSGVPGPRLGLADSCFNLQRAAVLTLGISSILVTAIDQLHSSILRLEYVVEESIQQKLTFPTHPDLSVLQLVGGGRNLIDDNLPPCLLRPIRLLLRVKTQEIKYY